jgi:hypothetical protein
LASIEKGSDRDALDIVGNAVERRDDGGEPQIARSCINRCLRLFHAGLLVDRHVGIAAELSECSRGLPLQACQTGLRRLKVAYRGIERGPWCGTRIKEMLLALVIGCA